MKRKVIYLWFIVLCLFGQVNAQQSGQASQRAQDGPQAVYLIPNEIGLSVIAHQPDSPLQIEKAVLLAGGGAKGVGAFQARNRDSREITGYTVAVWTSGNTKSVWTFAAPSRKDWVRPGQVVASNQEQPLSGVVTAPEDVRAKLNLTGPMRGLAVFLVVQVKFSDGTSYNDQATYTALQGYMETLSQKMKAQK